MNITFTNPEFLWLLISIPLLIISHFYIQKNLKTTAWKFANFEAIQRITGGKQTLKNAIKLNRNIIPLLLKLMVLTMLILAVAGTTLWYFGKSQNLNFVLAIDASSSMLAQDFEPNRFTVAKAAAVEFVDSLTGRGRIGVISFSGTSFVEQELDTDKFRTQETIKNLEIKSIGGTDLGEAIVTSTNLLSDQNEENPKPGAIILLTDGRSTTGTDVREAIDYAKDRFIRVHTIGVGTKVGGSFANIQIVSTIDEQSLQAISDSTGGSYYRAENEEALKNVYSAIAESDKENIPVNLRILLLILALAIFFIEYGLATTKFRMLP